MSREVYDVTVRTDTGPDYPPNIVGERGYQPRSFGEKYFKNEQKKKKK
jgi:hypothetical protein